MWIFETTGEMIKKNHESQFLLFACERENMEENEIQLKIVCKFIHGQEFYFMLKSD